MIVRALSQLDPEWANARIGSTSLKISRWGCTLVSLCMLSEKLRGYAANPADAARFWKFNGRGEILWDKTQWKGTKFIIREYYPDYEKLTQYANDPQRGAIMEVNHGKHWVFVEKVVGKTVEIIDPIDGFRYKGLPSKYKFTGYALFEAAPIDLPAWLLPLWERAKAKGLKATSPATELTMDTFLEALLEMKLIDKPKSQLNVGEFIAALDKIKDRW